MKRMKKLFAILMTMAMVMGLGITGFAAQNLGADGKYGTADDTGTIAVSGIEAGVTVKAYQIIEAQYENPGDQFSGYRVMYETTPDAITIPEDGLPVSISQAQMDQLEKMNLGTGVSMDWDNTTQTYKADVAPGTYLVRVTNSEAHIYNTMVVSVYYTKNSLNETVLDVSNAKAKMSDNPTIDKKVDEADGNSAEIGEKVTYTITVNPIPHYSGNYPVFNIVDTLSKGLTYNKDLAVTIDGEPFENYDINEASDNRINIDFVTDSDGYTLNGYTGKSMTITYSATVNKFAVVNENFNNNDAVLNYTHDSKVNGQNGNVEDKTYTYTFEIDGNGTTGIIDKLGNKTGDSDGLNGATFALYKENPDENTGAQPFKTAITDTVEGKKGQMTFSGLEANTTYYLKETDAPNGYSLNTKVYTVLIEAEYYGQTDSVSEENYGKLKTWQVKIDGIVVASFNVNVEKEVNSSITGVDINNTTISVLPSTGGMGTTIFTIAGCVIMISAAGLFFASRRKAN